MTKDEADKIEEKFKIIEQCNSKLDKTELRYDSDKIPLYTAFKAMDLYAKQEAIEFKNWYVKNGTFHLDNTGRIVAKNDEQLYSLYIQNKPQ